MKLLTPTENPTIETRIPTMDELLEAYIHEHGALPQLAVEPEQSRQRYTLRQYRHGLDETQELTAIDCEVLS